MTQQIKTNGYLLQIVAAFLVGSEICFERVLRLYGFKFRFLVGAASKERVLQVQKSRKSGLLNMIYLVYYGSTNPEIMKMLGFGFSHEKIEKV